MENPELKQKESAKLFPPPFIKVDGDAKLTTKELTQKQTADPVSRACTLQNTRI